MYEAQSMPTLSLSGQLRVLTRPLHLRTEATLGLPGAIRTREAYIAWLGRFLGLYEPLEKSFAGFEDWRAAGVALPCRSHSACLIEDLTALGARHAQVARATCSQLPHLPSFAHALGARYVLEGSRLGGRVILRDITLRLGPPVAGAGNFFGGRNEATGAVWQDFRAGLDRFGHAHPHKCSDVITGAEAVFTALLAWFAPLCEKEAVLF